MKQIPKFKIILLFSIFYFLFSYPFSAWAAILYLNPSQGELFQEDTFLVEIRIDVEEECINAIGAKINFPQDVLEAVDFTQGNSIILLWVEPPTIKQKSGLIYFSGVIPGGYCGRLPGDPGLSNLIGRIVFRVKDRSELEPSEEIIKVNFLEETEVLLNDGLGTAASLTTKGGDFKILSERAEILRDDWGREIEEDNIPPESFKIEIQNDPALFEGQYFITFFTDDKQTGINHYEVREDSRGLIKREGEWVTAESPYKLKDQDLRSEIFVKAVDKAGNERLETLLPQNPLAWYENIFIWVIIVLSVIIIYIVWRFMKKKKSRVNPGSLIILLLIITSLALPTFVLAASLYFSPSSGSYTVGSTLSTSVYISSANQATNAASGVISFPRDKLEVASLSKSGSIFSLWVQEPIFSNSAGTVNFEGIVLNPGFTGASGKVITINFKVKAAGTALLNFSSGSVLANDGKGTNILTSLGNAQFSLGYVGPTVPEATTPSAVSGAPSAPQISSPTHPDPNKWYAKKDAKFTWSIPSDVTGVRLLVGEIPAAIPTVMYTPAISEKEVTNLADGIWYFHVQLRNAIGWGEISHFRFQIDTEPPAPFEIKFVDGKETTNPRPTVIFDTTDSLSGIEYYKVKIGEGDFFPLSSETVQSNPYTLPLQAPGKRTILVQVFDKAGNYKTAVEEFVILPIEAPVITDYPQTLLPGAILLIKGTAVPEVKVKVYIQKDEKEVKADETKSNKEGKWSYTGTEPLEKGVYKIWAEAIDYSGAISNPSEKVTIQVIPPAFIRIGKLAIDYLTTFITLLILIFVMVCGIIWSWQKIKQRRKRLRKEITEAEKALYQAFKALREETIEQIAKLDGEPGLSEREKKVCDDLKKALKISEKFISKEIKDIEKKLE